MVDRQDIQRRITGVRIGSNPKDPSRKLARARGSHTSQYQGAAIDDGRPRVVASSVGVDHGSGPD
jgi:hypothetical protein